PKAIRSGAIAPTSKALGHGVVGISMTLGLCERPNQYRSICVRRPWSLQPVSKFIGQDPIKYLRRKAWTATPIRCGNGISAVTSLCLCDEASVGGPPVLISGDEDGSVSVQRVQREQETRECGDEGGRWPVSGLLATTDVQRVRLHSSCVNTIKILADKRGFVCAGDDGVLIAVSSLDVSTEADIRRATFTLTGHSGFVTDCDTTQTGHAILSSSTDGRMLLWDPVASNSPIATVSVGRPVNSACFSAGDPYALLCTPELSTGCPSSVGNPGSGSTRGRSGIQNEDIVQIWDLRSLRSFKDTLSATAMATALGEYPFASHRRDISMHPPTSRSPQERASSVWTDGTPHGSATSSGNNVRSTSAQVPSWLSMAVGSASAGSPATPLLRTSTWTVDDESRDAELSPSAKTRACSEGDSWCCGTPGPVWKESNLPIETESIDCPSRPSPSSSNSSSARVTRLRPGMGDQPCALLTLESAPASGCLHGGGGRTWVPGGIKSWQSSTRRFRTAISRTQECVRARSSAYSVRVSSDGRSIIVACRDRTVSLFDTQSRKVLYRFGHPQLSTRARPILVESGKLRFWRVGSQFPNRVFKSMGHHEGFDVSCLAASVDGSMFASGDSSGSICVQSATLRGGRQDLSGRGGH
ncbi:unnamed protein product, partial [Scytosiphon promiscuus]